MADELLDLIINKKPVTKKVVICGAVKTLTAGVTGFIMGGIMANANVQEENLINSRTTKLTYMGLPLALSSFPTSYNATGIAGMSAGDIVVDLVTNWLTFLGGCKD